MAKLGKSEGGPFRDNKNFLEKKKQKLRSLNSVTVPKNAKAGPFGFLTSILLQNWMGPFSAILKFLKKSQCQKESK